jgi:hypothetical protein
MPISRCRWRKIKSGIDAGVFPGMPPRNWLYLEYGVAHRPWRGGPATHATDHLRSPRDFRPGRRCAQGRRGCESGMRRTFGIDSQERGEFAVTSTSTRSGRSTKALSDGGSPPVRPSGTRPKRQGRGSGVGRQKGPQCTLRASKMAGWTGLEPATFCVTGRRSNQLSYHPVRRERERTVESAERESRGFSLVVFLCGT